MYHGVRAAVVILGPEVMPIDLGMACEGREFASLSWCELYPYIQPKIFVFCLASQLSDQIVF